MEEQIAHIPVEKLHAFMKACFQAYGYPESHATVSADVLIESDIRGITSHGVQRLKYYYDRVETGRHPTDTNFEVVKDKDATAVIDAHHCNGHWVAKNAMQIAIDKAKKYGLGMTAVRNSTHYGIAGYYSLMATKQGCIGITGTNARPAVTPTFGAEGMFGTNPLTYGIPTDEEFNFILDCATSIIQRGKVEEYARKEDPTLPDNCVIDGETGEIRRDAPKLLEDFVKGKAALLPLGGKGEETAGYKGYGYAMVVELLSAALQDGKFLKDLSGFTEEGKPTNYRVGHFFIAIDVEHFIELNTFKKIAGRICREVRRAKKVPGEERIYTAGEKEYIAQQKVMKEGVPINKSLQKELIFLRDKFQLKEFEFNFE